MDIFGAIKKLRDMGGAAVQGATQLGGSVGHALQQAAPIAQQVAQSVVPVNAGMAQNVGRMINRPAISPSQPGVNFNPGGGVSLPATMPSIKGVNFSPDPAYISGTNYDFGQVPSFLDLKNNEAVNYLDGKSAFGDVQNPYQLDNQDRPMRPTQPLLPQNINFNPGGYSMPATMPDLPIYLKRR